MNLLNVALFGAGALLIASAIKKTTPRELIMEAMGKGEKGTVAGGSWDDEMDSGSDEFGTVAGGSWDRPQTPYVVTSP